MDATCDGRLSRKLVTCYWQCDYDQVWVPGRRGDGLHFPFHPVGRYSCFALVVHGIDVISAMKADAGAEVEPVKQGPTTTVLD